MSLQIPYESEDFDAKHNVHNGAGLLDVTWDELLWSALTIGRRNLADVFAHGQPSVFEALFRCSLLRMAIEQSGPRARRLRRTEAAKALDPTEKGAVNYFIGMIVCKLFIARLLDAPWALHLDLYREEVNAVVSGRSRPDLIAQVHGTSDWIAIEAKGRATPPDRRTKRNAKLQAERLEAVHNTIPICQVGCVTFYRNDVVNFWWIDPEPKKRKRPPSFKVPHPGSDLPRLHYESAVAIVETQKGIAGAGILIEAIRTADLEVTLHPAISEPLLAHHWDDAMKASLGLSDDFERDGFHPDGLKVVAGEKWAMPFEKNRML